MSNDDSVSTTGSHLRQFGLYRSIDARTEEFLRLSRKRQIKQGCACAAISTAVTVIVVICVILVYEYIVISESSRSTSHNWRNLMNSSKDSLIFNQKLNNNLYLDSSTNKILPLFLKTLREKGHIDEITEFYNLKDDTTESYSQNIFSDIKKKWVKKPTSLAYSDNSKILLFPYFKKPTRNIDDYIKTREIKDYNRIMKYVDKMINDVPVGITIPVVKNKLRFVTDNTPTTPVLARKYARQQITMENNEQPFVTKGSIKKKKSDCKCEDTRTRNTLLSKIISCLQNNVPDFNDLRIFSSYNPNHTHLKNSVSTVTERSTNPSFLHEETTTFPYFLNINKSSPLKIPKNIDKYIDPSPPISNLWRPKIRNLKANKFNFKYKTVMPLISTSTISDVRKKLSNDVNDYKIKDNVRKLSEESVITHISGNNKDSFVHSLYSTLNKEKKPNTNKNIKKKNRVLNANSPESTGVKENFKYLNSMNLKKETLKGTKNIFPYIRNYSSVILQDLDIKTDSAHTTKSIKTINSNNNFDRNNLSVILNNVEQMADLEYWAMEEENQKVVVDEKNTKNKTIINDNRGVNKKEENKEEWNLEKEIGDYKDENPLIHFTSRPSYLEISHNNFKQEDTNDYDNANNYIFM